MTARDDARDPRLPEALLTAAAVDASWPPTPDLRSAVMARIMVPAAPDMRASVLARVAEPGGSPRGGSRSLGRLARPMLLATIVVLALAGVAVGLGFRLPGLEIQRVDQLPPAGTGLNLGTPIPLAEALAFERPRVLLPASLRPPGGAFLLDAGIPGGIADPIVTVAWRAERGQPVLAATDLALSLMAVPGDTDEALLSKLAGPGTTIEPVTIDGARGWWIAGAPHEILIRQGGSGVVVLRAAIAGDTLVFVRDGTLYRLESSLGRDATIEVASSLR